MTIDPFSLKNDGAFQVWRKQKLANYPGSIDSMITEIGDPSRLTRREVVSIKQCVARANFAIYQLNDSISEHTLLQFGNQLGLSTTVSNPRAESSGISVLRVNTDKSDQEYIPYTNKPLAWHTDGYYNTMNDRVSAFILHCHRCAQSGGTNDILDHEIAYILLRDENPAYIEALMNPAVMTIPANIQGAETLRSDSVGPVFSTTCGSYLHMRYTARTRSISWKDDPIVDKAREFLNTCLESRKFVLSHMLENNQGLVCNNVLHTRSRFVDSENCARTLLRLRYADRISCL